MESEDIDRVDLQLPGKQLELLQTVTEAGECQLRTRRPPQQAEISEQESIQDLSSGSEPRKDLEKANVVTTSDLGVYFHLKKASHHVLVLQRMDLPCC